MMLEAKDVRLSIGKKEILRGANLSAKPGEITALLGRNGSGKTTLLRCMAGTQERYTGSICLDGAALRDIRVAQRARMLSLLPQVLPRPPVTVAELAAFGRQPYTGAGGRMQPEDQKAVEQAISLAGIQEHKNDRVCHLSGGERQLAFFALLLAQDTPVALLDEPTSNLDAEYRRMVYSLLGEMKERGKTVVVILHDLADAVELADHIVVLEGGKTCFAGEPRAFLSGRVPQQIFGLEPIRVTDSGGRGYTLFRPYPEQHL